MIDDFFPSGTRIRLVRGEHCTDGNGNDVYLMPCSEGVLEKDYHHGDTSILVRIRPATDNVVGRIWPGFVSFYPKTPQA